MPSAPCPRCGQSVMPYRRYAVHLPRIATCMSCGRRVRIRGYEVALTGAVIAGIALIAYMFFVEPDVLLGRVAAILAVTTAIAFAIDYSMWRWLGFAPTADSAEAVPAPGSAEDAPAPQSAGPPSAPSA